MTTTMRMMLRSKAKKGNLVRSSLQWQYVSIVSAECCGCEKKKKTILGQIYNLLKGPLRAQTVLCCVQGPHFLQHIDTNHKLIGCVNYIGI